MKKRRGKKSVSEFFADLWLDLRFKLIMIASLFIAIMLVIVLIVTDTQNDKILLESKANKYETYIDQLLIKKFSVAELKAMNVDELKLAVDIVIDEANNLIINAPVLNDFILPIKDDDYTSVFKPIREPKNKWTQDDIDKYWIELDTLNIKDLEKNNFEYLKARLKDIR